MNNVSGNIVLQAIYDGTTLMTELAAGGKYPLIQKYKLGERKIIPDYNDQEVAKIPNNEKPILYPVITRTDTATPPQIHELHFLYNSVEVAVVKTQLSNTDQTTGVNKWDTDANDQYKFRVVNKYDSDENLTGNNKFDIEMYTYKLNETTSVEVPAIRIVKNLVDLDADGGLNLDTDIISCYGKVEVDGFMVDFQEIRREFKIMEDTGNKYTLWLEASNLGQFTDAKQEIIITAHADVDGDLVADAINGTDYYLEWYKADVTSNSGYTKITSGIKAIYPDQYTLKVGDVDAVANIRAVLFKNGGTRCASASIDIHDLTDPYVIKWEVTEMDGTGKVDGFVLRKGGKAKVAASVVSRNTGIVNWGTASTWQFSFAYYNNSGVLLKGMPVTNQDDSHQCGYSIIKYEHIRDAGRRLMVYCTATKSSTFKDNYDKALEFVAKIADAIEVDATDATELKTVQKDALGLDVVQNAIYSGTTFGDSQKAAAISKLVQKGYTAKS